MLYASIFYRTVGKIMPTFDPDKIQNISKGRCTYKNV